MCEMQLGLYEIILSSFRALTRSQMGTLKKEKGMGSY